MMFSDFDRLAMTRALALAERGIETTHPNPRVGCVIAAGERIIAEGWHERAGEAHAEVVALRAAKESVAGATAYVTLEPCSHHGRTPPCVNALIEARLARVVFAVEDPNPLVSGQGAAALLHAGITVEAGLMEAEATELNIGFIKRMKRGLPWVRVKLAMSLDGRTALANGASQWITGEQARDDVQRWRARSSAVMTGVGTVLADDPQLNVRMAGFNGRQPLRVVLDSRLRSPPGARMFVGVGGARAGAGPRGLAGTGGGAAVTAGTGQSTVASRGGGAGVSGGVSATQTGDVLIFTAAGAGVPTANPAGSGVAAYAEGGAASARSDPDDATWAGAALSGAVPVKAQAKEPADTKVSVPSAKPDSPAAFQARRAALAERGLRIEEVAADDGFLDLLAILRKLAEINVNEVLVEAGPTLAGRLLASSLADELLLYIAPKLLGPQGRPLVNLPELQSMQDARGFCLFDTERFGDDLRLRLRPK